MGNALLRQKRFGAAIACYCSAARFDTNSPDLHNNLGYALGQQGRFDEAIGCLLRAIDLDPKRPKPYYNLGDTLRKQGRLNEAVVAYARLLSIDPDNPEAYHDLGRALSDQQRLRDAANCLHTAIALRPRYAEAHNDLGLVLGKQRHLTDAAGSYRTAIELEPDFAEAHNNLGTVLEEQRDLPAAIACYQRAIGCRADFAEAHANLGMALLASGDMAAGWAEYEWRGRTAEGLRQHRDPGGARWHGEPAQGRTLLIQAEQGFGDTIQFCRYAPMAADRGFRVIVQVPKPLVRLLGNLPGTEVIAGADDPPRFDLYVPMLSLPLALGAPDPVAPPRLRPDARQVAVWRSRLAETGRGDLRIGVNWAGDPGRHGAIFAAIDGRRSIPPERLAPLFAQQGTWFLSMCKDGPEVPHGAPVTDFMPEMHDFADTAALIANLDLLITVDTAVAHLGASLGKPVWLLNRFDSCWRWGVQGRDTPWYPTMRIYRQPAPGDWDSVLADVARDLASIQAVHDPFGVAVNTEQAQDSRTRVAEGVRSTGRQ
jgi:Flp pilus assembly protein TadD